MTSPRLSVRALAAALALGTAVVAGAQTAGTTLQIYFIDVEGGAATLIVTPARESVLLDAGWADVDGRDARRIQAAMKRAGVERIDHLIASHYHQDHYGGVPDLARTVDVRRFYDHGEMSEMKEDERFQERYAAYRAAARGGTMAVSPGDSIPLAAATGLPAPTLKVVASNGAAANESGTPNRICVQAAPQTDSSENGRSVGILLKIGGFEFLNLADLVSSVSLRLVCPTNQLGAVDLYQVTHHGSETANQATLLESITPTVAVMINGPRKGGHPDAIRRLIELPSMRGLYQLHRNVQNGAAANTPEDFIANLAESPDAAHAIVVSVNAAGGTFTVTNERTGVTRTYAIN
jgi:beta-lactamase superfamily II metal-dependent hydrolase